MGLELKLGAGDSIQNPTTLRPYHFLRGSALAGNRNPETKTGINPGTVLWDLHILTGGLVPYSKAFPLT